MRAYLVYVLRCRDGSYYVGHTNDLERRLGEHADGRGNGYVANRLPFKLLHVDQFEDRDQAFAFERQLKSWSRAKKEAYMQHQWEELGILAMPPKEREQRLLRVNAAERRISSRAQSRDALGSCSNERMSLDCARDDESGMAAVAAKRHA